MLNIKSLKGYSDKKLRDHKIKSWNKVILSARKIDHAKSSAQIAAKNAREKRKKINARLLIKSLQKRKRSYKSNYISYSNELLNRSSQINKKNKRKNSLKVAKNVKHHHKFTNIYRSDHQDNIVMHVAETDPSESESYELSSEAQDADIPQINNVTLDAPSYNGTYYIMGFTKKELDLQYNQFRHWANEGAELTIDGFSYWPHAKISSLGKSTSQEINGNGLIASINFQYMRKAKIQYAKQTKHAHRKPQAQPKQGTHASSHKYVRIKPGMTYAQISNAQGTSIRDLQSMNKFSSSNLPVGKKVRIS